MRSAIWGILGAFLAIAAAWGQSEPADAGVVIRSTTRLVQVRLVAEDSAGKPIADLKREEFQIQDNRQPQPITLFSVDRGATAKEDAVSSGEAGENTIEPAGYALIVLDWLNTLYPERLRSRDLLVRMLKNYQPRQKLAVYLLGHQQYLVHDFTSDMAELIQAVEQADLEPAYMDNSAPGRFDARYGSPADRKVGTEERLLYLHNQVEDTMHAFQDIAVQLAHVPGRKSLLWLSAGFPIVVGPGVVPGARPAEMVFTMDVEKILERLNRSDVAVYAVDACGLSTTKCGYPGSLLELAERTGGTAFTDRNDLDTGMRVALEDMRMSYILGFHVPDHASPGLHEIRVTVKRAGVRLRYRASYQLQ